MTPPVDLPHAAGRLHLLLLLAFLCPAAAAGQELSESQAIDAALQNNFSLKQSRAERDAARARLYEGVSFFLPQVTLAGHYNRLSEPQFPADFAGPALSGIPPSFITDRYYDAVVAVKQPLFAWGANLSRFQQGRLDYALAQEKFRQRKSDTVYQTRELYYRALLASATLAIAREAWELSTRRLSMTEAQKLRGKVSRYELNRASVALTNDRVAVSKTEKDARRALSALVSFIRGSAETVVAGALPTTAPAYTLTGILADVRASNPRLRQARAARGGAQAQFNAARADLFPDFFATYSRTLQRSAADNGAAWDTRWQAQLGVEWDLFSGLKHAAALQRTGGNLGGADAGLEALEAELALEAQGAFLDYEQARESLDLQAANIELAGRNRTIAEEKYALGLISVLELQDVQLALSQARLNYQQALFDHALAAAAIERLRGTAPEESADENAH